ncbi:MAG: hypothetical protein KGZ25_02510 [Planctomycetes bacterium]|nr:hypothetical protein [Planctomycetota bacterium]
MEIRILATESLGVRGLCCFVETGDRKILIDPGISLGYKRHGFLPHPIQIAAGVRIREEIISVAKNATDIVISHWHGDHAPLVDANPYQMPAGPMKKPIKNARLWTKGIDAESDRIRERVESLAGFLGQTLPESAGNQSDNMLFSKPIPHGEKDSNQGNVMMTRIQEANQVFVHASDIQLLDEEAVQKILSWQPTIVLASGPPIYLNIGLAKKETARRLGRMLAQGTETLIIDHHLLRCLGGIDWINDMSRTTGNRVVCAADFMNRPRDLLEARRSELYELQPVPENWHEKYRHAKADLGAFGRPSD